MEVQGKIKVKGEAKTFGAKEFKKQELVIETQEQYPQPIMVEFVQDKCELLNSYNIGDSVKVSINLRGREWINPEGVAKYFNSVQGWRIEKVEEAPQGNLPPVQDLSNNEPDNLPF